jgi:hypothetical protein
MNVIERLCIIYALAPKPAIVVPIATWDVAVVLLGEFEARLNLQNGCFKWRKILRNSCFDHRPGRVEIVVRKPVAHTGRVRPLDIWLARDQLGIQQLHCLANLDEASPNGVENESVGEVATSEVTPDCGNRVNNVAEVLVVVS